MAAVAAAGGQRTTRLSMLALILDGILEPGVGLLTFDYMVRSKLISCLSTNFLFEWGSLHMVPKITLISTMLPIGE